MRNDNIRCDLKKSIKWLRKLRYNFLKTQQETGSSTECRNATASQGHQGSAKAEEDKAH